MDIRHLVTFMDIFEYKLGGKAISCQIKDLGEIYDFFELKAGGAPKDTFSVRGSCPYQGSRPHPI
jgi:hypothetical protein